MRIVDSFYVGFFMFSSWTVRADGIDIAFPDREGNRRPIIIQKTRDGNRHDRHDGRADSTRRTLHDTNDGSDAAQTTRSSEPQPADPNEEAEAERLERKFGLRESSA